MVYAAFKLIVSTLHSVLTISLNYTLHKVYSTLSPKTHTLTDYCNPLRACAPRVNDKTVTCVSNVFWVKWWF